jgi:hypothetical protein
MDYVHTVAQVGVIEKWDVEGAGVRPVAESCCPVGRWGDCGSMVGRSMKRRWSRGDRPHSAARWCRSVFGGDGSDQNRAEGVWMRCDVWSRFPGGHGGWWFMAGCVGLGDGLAIAPLAIER